MEAGLSVVRAFDQGLVLKPEDLVFDLETYKADLTSAQRGALGLAVETEYILPETAPLILGRAFREAMQLANEAEFPTSENIGTLVKQAYSEMRILSDAAVQINSELSEDDKVAQTPTPQENSREKVEKKEKQ
jgi:large subunit ribosomal protein L10